MTARYEIELVDIDDVDALRRAVDAMSDDGRPRYLRRGETVLATLQPQRRLRHAHRQRRLRPRISPKLRQGSFGKDDPIWGIVGIAGSVGPTDIAKYKDEYIAEALEDEFM